MLFKTIISSLIFIQSAYSAPSQVVIIRHGEKPLSGNELNEKGWKRANALVSYVAENIIINEFGPPVALYAGAPTNPGGSIRSIQTITPLALKLGLAIHKSITKNELNVLVNEVLNSKEYENRTVFICWEHSLIPEMAHLFGASEAPETWDSSVFDRSWVIRFSNNKVVGFQNIAQQLLPGDSTF